MNKPYFSINEEVILQSVEFPQYNGEYIVKDFLVNRFDGYVYDLGFKIDNPIDGRSDHLWKQSVLRKKHQPSEMTFHELMSSLNVPIKEMQK